LSSDAESKKKTTPETSIDESKEEIVKLLKEILWIVKQSLPKPKKSD
jgi:hypothetical protein